MAGAFRLPMESENKTQGSQSARSETILPVQLHRELLMAAREGNSARLIHLLGNGQATQPVPSGPGVVVNIGDAHATMSKSALAMDLELNKILHVVASSGDSPNFLESARVVYGKASHLLDGCTAKGDTPFHCAARAGMVKMLSELISLARAEGGGGDRVKEVLRKPNKQGETALHEALRFGDKARVEAMVSMLMAADAELARVPPVDGTSPLYLAVLLGHDDIAERLHQHDEGLSYSGPNGQNALHAAVLGSIRMTENLLKWNKDLSKQGDKNKGSTPLHFAASRGFLETVTALLNSDKSIAYQPDNGGSFPIHVAVIGKNHNVVYELLTKCPDCAQQQDAQGKTFLHIAAQQGYSDLFCFVFPMLQGKPKGKPSFSSIINMQDNDGNTGLHLAVKAGTLWPFYFIMLDKDVTLNLSNCEQKTALDISQSNIPTGVQFDLDPRRTIHSLLKLAGGRYGGAHSGNHDPELDEKEEADKIMDCTQTIGVVAALVVTITFAAAFSVPGGYRADDDPKLSNHTAGTPVLAASPSFQAFIIANNIAMFCSTMATISITYAGVPAVDIRTRKSAFGCSVFFLNSSARSLAAAFAFGMYAALAPVAHAAAVVTWICMAATLVDVAWFVTLFSTSQLVLCNRLGIGACMLRFVGFAVVPLIAVLWPYAIIGGFLAYSKSHGIH